MNVAKQSNSIFKLTCGFFKMHIFLTRTRQISEIVLFCCVKSIPFCAHTAVEENTTATFILVLMPWGPDHFNRQMVEGWSKASVRFTSMWWWLAQGFPPHWTVTPQRRRPVFQLRSRPPLSDKLRVESCHRRDWRRSKDPAWCAAGLACMFPLSAPCCSEPAEKQKDNKDHNNNNL